MEQARIGFSDGKLAASHCESKQEQQTSQAQDRNRN